jgi:hypothetical protein
MVALLPPPPLRQSVNAVNEKPPLPPLMRHAVMSLIIHNPIMGTTTA